MNFLYPSYLFAIAGIIIPILIHLWNIRKGKTLKVGSILLLAESSKQQARSLRLHNILLLILRCLIIIFFSFLLAEPVIKMKESSRQKTGWIIAEKATFAAGYKVHRNKIDSLLNEGYEMHDAVAGYPALSISDTAFDNSSEAISEPANFWALLSDLNQRLPQKFPVFFLMPEYINRFEGSRPASNIQSEWLGFFLASNDSTWVQRAYISNSDSIHIVSINVNDSLTRYITEVISANQPSTGSKQLNDRDGDLFVDVGQGEKTNSIPVDTSILRIAIYAKPADRTAAYIEAAVNAIAEYSKRKIQVELFTDLKNVSTRGDWLFWIADGSIPSELQFKNSVVFMQGAMTTGNSWVNTRGTYTNLIRSPSVSKSIRDSGAVAQGEMLWTDGYGNPLLTKTPDSDFTRYHLYFKLEPGWTELPWHEQFPELLLKLIFDNTATDTAFHKSMKIDAAQILPNPQPVGNFVAPAENKYENLKNWIWVILFLLFFMERFISFRRHAINKL